MTWQLRNRRDRVVLETDDMLTANGAFWRRSRRGAYTKLFRRALDGSWLLIAYGVHDFVPHWQERTPKA
jgi:hypothetical protein